MPNSRAQPGLGLSAFWDVDSDDWAPGMDTNLQTLSVVAQLSVESMTAGLADPVANGEVYIVPNGADEGKIAFGENGATVLIVPIEGAQAYVRDTGTLVLYDGSTWNPITGSLRPQVVTRNVGSTLTLADSGTVIRNTSAVDYTHTVPDDTTTAFPIGTVIHFVQASTGTVTIAADSANTVTSSQTLTLRAQGSAASLLKTDDDEWLLVGDLVSA